MSPSYEPGNAVLVSSLPYGLRMGSGLRLLVRWGAPIPGDVVVFYDPVEGGLTMKRCIGVTGDKLIISENTIAIANHRFSLSPSQVSYFKRHTAVPDGHIFVAGDNPDGSIDSRHFGFLSVHAVVGKVIGGEHG